MTFGEKLLNARLKLNLSQIELGEKVGISERSIYSYEQTGVLPRLPVVKRIAEALNVSVSYLMDEEENNKQRKDSDNLFIANAKNRYGSKGAREAQAILEQAAALFAGGELTSEAKDIFIHSLMEVYLESKAESRSKFAPRRRVSRKA
jgi:transcriptional regulator with XRE-family HTH domain